MQFGNPIAAGSEGRLVRASIRSPDYTPGVSGWTINRDGTAEFNNVTVRGTLESSNYAPGVSGWQLLESGTAELNDATFRGTVTLTSAGQSLTLSSAGLRIPETNTATVGGLNAVNWVDSGGTIRSRVYGAGFTIRSLTVQCLYGGIVLDARNSGSALAGLSLGYNGLNQAVLHVADGADLILDTTRLRLAGSKPLEVGGRVESGVSFVFIGDTSTGLSRNAPGGLRLTSGGVTCLDFANTGTRAATFNELGGSNVLNTSAFATTPMHWAGVDIYGLTSSRRLKRDVRDASALALLEIVDELRPRTWLPSPDDVLVRRGRFRGDLQRVGFVLEELAAIAPELVSADRRSLDLSALSALLVGAVQDLRRRVAAIERGKADGRHDP